MLRRGGAIVAERMGRTALVREVFRNLRSRATLSLGVGLGSAAIGAVIVLAPLAEVGARVRLHEEQIARGQAVFAVRAEEGTGVSARRCDALGAVEGVRAAGGVVSSERVTLAIAAGRERTRACLVEAEYGARGAVEALRVGWFAADGPTLTLPSVDPTGIVEVERLVAERLTRVAGPIGAALALCLLGLGWALRRAEYALYRLVDPSRANAWLMLCAEGVLLFALPLLTGACAALAVAAPGAGPPLMAAGRELLTAIVLAPLAPALGWAITRGGGPVRILKR